MLKITPTSTPGPAGPLESPDDGMPSAAGKLGQQMISPPATPAAPIRVLLVDDHEDTNRSLVLLLGRRGYKARSATSLHEAVQAAGEGPFDILITDMSLPDGNGLGLLSRLGAKAPAHGAIVLSGYNDDDDLERSRVAGYKAHFAKPVDVAKLDEAMRRMIRESSGGV